MEAIMDIFVVSWLVCGVFSAVIAKSKGRSFLLWLFLGLLFGLFALLASGFMSVVSEDRKSMKKCPLCAEYISNDAIFCRFCGNELSKKKLKEGQCPECGKKLGRGLSDCNTCRMFRNS
jgi:predicted RNA-binding Zn-ribbon protein involved in translation (DUF1610 family)